MCPLANQKKDRKIILKCGCRGSLNKRKKTFIFEKFCDKHMAELKERIHDQMWYGCYWKDIVKQCTDFINEQGTIQVSPTTLFWLRWLEEQRSKALRFTYRGHPIVISKPEATQ